MVRVSKQAMKAEIKELKAYQHASEFVLSHLASEDRSDLILRQLQEGKSLQHIYKTLKGDAAPVQSAGTVDDHKTSAKTGLESYRTKLTCATKGEPRSHKDSSCKGRSAAMLSKIPCRTVQDPHTIARVPQCHHRHHRTQPVSQSKC